MSKDLAVILALKALVEAAVPSADVAGFDKDAQKPTRIGAGGCVIGHPGEPGDPEVDLSPLTYNYSHRMWLEVIGPNGEGGAAIDALLTPIGAAIRADTTLGGLCMFVSAGAPGRGGRSTDTAASTNWALVPVDAEYSTEDPLA